jgi:beta-lactam-binding protein with PASTA domain
MSIHCVAIDIVVSLGVEPLLSPSPSASGADWPQVPDLRCSSIADASALLSALGLSLDAPSALLDPTDRIDSFSPFAGVSVELGSEITIVSSVPAGTSLAGCSP